MTDDKETFAATNDSNAGKTPAKKEKISEERNRTIDDSAATETKRLWDEVVRQDFPASPDVDKHGNPKWSELDEQLSYEPMNDLGNMQRMKRRFGDQVIFVEKVGWHAFTGTHWTSEEGKAIVSRRAQDTARAMKQEKMAYLARGKRGEESNEDFAKRIGFFGRFANDCGNMKRITGMVAALQSHVTHLHTVLDKHLQLLTVENGTLELFAENGPKLRGHRPADFISKKMPVRYDPKAGCENFRKALADILPDPELQRLLQIFFGYCLTGEVKEQIVMMWYGKEGSNGKSFLMELFNWLMGTYATRIPIASLMSSGQQRSGSQASPELARLPGARLITATEPKKGSVFDDGMLKVISGEDAIQARHLGESFIDFKLQGKLCISFNDKPRVADGGEAFWRRVVMIPFDQVFKHEWELKDFPGAKVIDPELRKKCEAEAPGILNWMIEGYSLWKKEGFRVPEKVRMAVEEYRLENNSVLEFVREWCVTDPKYSITFTPIFNAYKAWMEKKGETAKMGSRTFADKLAQVRGVEKKRERDGMTYCGITLTADGHTGAEDWIARHENKFPWTKKREAADDEQERKNLAEEGDISLS